MRYTRNAAVALWFAAAAVPAIVILFALRAVEGAGTTLAVGSIFVFAATVLVQAGVRMAAGAGGSHGVGAEARG